VTAPLVVVLGYSGPRKASCIDISSHCKLLWLYEQ
jgi:hypothetical protein